MYYTYVIQSQKNNRYYIGSTKDLNRRLLEHNSNNTQSLKNKGPYKLVYKESFLTVTEARKREKEIKSYKGGNAFKKLLIL
jgi:putative endonuclease